jgi:hypothetical protein
METVSILTLIGIVIIAVFVIRAWEDAIARRSKIDQIHQMLTTQLAGLQTQQILLHKIYQSINELFEKVSDLEFGSAMTKGQMMMYKTTDGKYTAGSLEELFDKLKKDGAEQKYLSPEEMDNLRNLFSSELDEDDEDDPQDKPPF